MTGGTGVGAYFGGTPGGKTGTTDTADAWFCGFFPVSRRRSGSDIEGGSGDVRTDAVSGPTFPATIWKPSWRRRLPTLPEGVPAAEDLAGRRHLQLQYAMSGSYSTPSAYPAQTTTTNSETTPPTASPYTTDPVGLAAPAAAAIPIYLAACAVPDEGSSAPSDSATFISTRDSRCRLRRVPYRDFFMEYPPGALVFRRRRLSALRTTTRCSSA
jgi:hypothetical protein